MPQRSLGERAVRVGMVAAVVVATVTGTSGCAADAGDPGETGGDQSRAVQPVREPSSAAPPPSTGATEKSSADANDFEGFWHEFRRAVLEGDTAAVVAMTEFPFRTRGPMDSDPIVKHDRAGFIALLPRLLAQDPGLTVDSSTMESLVRNAVTAAPDAAYGDEARVGDFVFMRIEGRWRFVRAYTAES